MTAARHDAREGRLVGTDIGAGFKKRTPGLSERRRAGPGSCENPKDKRIVWECRQLDGEGMDTRSIQGLLGVSPTPKVAISQVRVAIRCSDRVDGKRR